MTAAADTTAGTAPSSAAAAPDSNAPSSFDALMNTFSTALTRPRSSFGVARAAIVERMFIENMSTKPLTVSATSDSQKPAREPEHDHAHAERADDDQQRPSRMAAERPARQADAGDERADRGGTAQHAEPERARVQDRACEQRQQRDRAAEQDGEQVERDRSEQDRRRADEANPAEQALAPRRLFPGARRSRGSGTITTQAAEAASMTTATT